MKRASHFSPRPRSDLILWDKSVDEPVFLRDLLIGDDVDATIRHRIIDIIHDNWDSFCERRISRPMLDFEFCINTSNSPPFCCRQPVYGFYESKIVTKRIADLETSKLIRDCEDPWGFLLLLAAKPHQESCTDIQAFIWRFCVSYRPLNSITLGFEFPIPRCADSTEDLGDSCGPIFIISLDTRSGYHQIRVRKCDQEKLAFFTPGGEKETYEVLPFGPTNEPSFYTTMMHTLRKEWLLLYADTKHIIHLNSSAVSIICNYTIIIDDILLYSNHVNTLLQYFSCVVQAFTKYRLSFKLTKCEFLKPRV